MKHEWIGRYRRCGNSVSISVPLELRKILQWPVGSYLIMTWNEGILFMRRVDRSMIVGPEHGQAGVDRA